jgi:Xaa-Pro aminopeptidase
MADTSADPHAAPNRAEPEVEHRQRPSSAAFRAFISSGWAARTAPLPTPLAAAAWTGARRDRLSAMLAHQRLVVPAGVLRVRSNDTDYRFRAHSAFTWLTGLGAEAEPDSVLVLEPRAHGGHDALLFVRPRAERDSEEFYANARYGELWVGPRPTLEEVSALTGLAARHIEVLADALAKDVGPDGVRLAVVREADPAVDAQVEQVRATAGTDSTEGEAADRDLTRILSELRLVKDAYEVEELRRAVAATARGFADIVRALPEAIGPRGERVVETAFEGCARREGNGVGYDTIAAAGHHACTLHWIRNDGAVAEGDLLLVDAGVEADSLYTADVTRTLPVSGRFSTEQRRVYELVLEAADAAFEVVRPGRTFREVHEAAMRVIATRLHEWGWLPAGPEESLRPEGQFHRRWMVHGTSHHLGLDVHDCAQARRETYLDAVLEPGMVFTIEPGLYVLPDDERVPEAMRGIGVRIEDDVVVTAEGCENLSAMLPRSADDVEEWMASLR